MSGYSLHIGLNRVDPDAYGGWDGALAGCINDATSMRRLAEAEGFTATSLLDEQATSQAVIGEINWMATMATAGDICLVSYSGHGGQLADQNGDEADQSDETWVCYDRQVLDDELAQMWTQFEPGVRVLVVSDSCHSGTVARALALQAAARDAGVGAVAVAERPVIRQMPLDVQRADNLARRGTYQFVQALSGSRSARSTSAAVILLAGCQDSQLSYDGAVNGRFTGELLTVWADGRFSGSYREFVAAITRRMPTEQIPNLDTTGATDLAFLAQQPFTVAAPILGQPGNDPSEPSEPTDPGEPSQPAERPVLRLGSTGDDVRHLQRLLADLGYSITVDGAFGPGTQRTVRSFQRSMGLVADGTVGANTWQVLESTRSDSALIDTDHNGANRSMLVTTAP